MPGKGRVSVWAADAGSHLHGSREGQGTLPSARPSVMRHFWGSLGRVCAGRLVHEGKAED